MHGDAAFAGQGVVAETLNLSQLRGYRTGGTVHVVVNNQVGFTTSPSASRSSLYCTDVARMIAAPIFHVNGDDPEACVRVAKLAVEYRREFKKDVVIDMVCYRRRGHNEADNPSFTQPLMYDIIDSKRSVRKLYTEALVGRGDITLEDAEAALQGLPGAAGEGVRRDPQRDRHRPAPEPDIEHETPSQHGHHRGHARASSSGSPTRTPTRRTGFTIHPRLKPQIDRRVAMASSRRRRLGHRRAVRVRLAACSTGAPCGWPARTRAAARSPSATRCSSTATPARSTRRCATCTPDQAPFLAYDSLLSEYAAMGFEYGYSVARDDALVCWEAQFGDFVDGAQTIIDEFISSGEAKWGQRSRGDAAAAARLRGPGPGPLVRAARAVPAAVRREQHDGRDVLVAGQLLPPAAPPGAVAGAPAAGRVHPEVAAAAARRRSASSTSSPSGAFQPVHPRRRGRRRRGAPGAAVQRQGLLRPRRRARARASAPTSRSCASSSSTRCRPTRSRPSSAATRTPRWCGCRRSRRTRARWPFIALNLPEHLDGRPLLRASRRASASPAVGSVAVHEAQQHEVVATAFA